MQCGTFLALVAVACCLAIAACGSDGPGPSWVATCTIQCSVVDGGTPDYTYGETICHRSAAEAQARAQADCRVNAGTKGCATKPQCSCALEQRPDYLLGCEY